MGEARRVEKVSVEDYLARERESDVRHEYVDGELFAMAGASRAHGIAVTNLVRELGNRLRGGPCRIGSSDMKVRSAPGSRYYYPDIVVSCNDESEEPDPYTESQPTLLVEVLSTTTEATDRRERSGVVYQSMPSGAGIRARRPRDPYRRGLLPRRHRLEPPAPRARTTPLAPGPRSARSCRSPTCSKGVRSGDRG